MISLRPHQTTGIKLARERYREGHRSVLLVAPCGAGKTLIFCWVARSAVERGGRVLVVVHRRELVKQTVAKMRLSGLGRVGIIAAGEPSDPDAPVQVASICTLLARVKRSSGGLFVGDGLPDATLVVPDEAHHYVSDEWSLIKDRYAAAKILGVTATPERGDGRALGDLFDVLVPVASVKELIAAGYLVPCDVIAPPKKMKRNHEDPVDAYVKHGGGRKAVVFASSVKAAYELAGRFTMAGFPAACIEGEMDAGARDIALDRFARGELRVLVNVFVLTEGWDCLDEETEILTADGWRGIGHVKKGDIVESLNLATGQLESTVVESYGERELRPAERMVTLRSQHVDIRTTEGHRYFVKYRDPARNGALSTTFLEKTGAELVARRSAYALPLTSTYEQPFPGVALTDDELRFVAWFMTDGGFERTAVCISQSKEFRHEIRALLGRLDLDFTSRVRPPRKGSYANAKPLTVFRIPKGTGSNKRRGWFARFAPYLDKCVSELLHGMTREQFLVFWSELLKGDGESSAGRAGWLWCDKAQADAYSAIAIRRGLSASFSTRTTANGVLMCRLSIREARWLTSDPSDPRAARVGFDAPREGERVWCVSNRNRTVITRRRGKVAIIGNCPSVEVCILARGCSSAGTYLQMVGRCMRPSPETGKTRALLIDLRGVCHEHDLPDADRVYSLEGRGIGGGGEAPLKTCKACDHACAIACRVCPACGKEFPAAGWDEKALPLTKIEKAEVERTFFVQALDRARMRGWKDGYAAHAFVEKFGRFPAKLWRELVKGEVAA